MDKKPLRCIIVDDEPLAQQILENYVQKVSELKLIAKCETIEEAFQILSSEKIDLIFLDLNLNAASGTEIIDNVKNSKRTECYIIITSANLLTKVDVANTGNVIIIDHLKKPFSFKRFLEAVRKVIGSQYD
jgi:response regulator of citrate/malate metabolism